MLITSDFIPYLSTVPTSDHPIFWQNNWEIVIFGHIVFISDTIKIKNMIKSLLCRSSDYGYTRLYVANSTHLRIQQVNAEQNGKIIDEIWIQQTNHGPFCYECY